MEAGPPPLRASKEYLRNRPAWFIVPCLDDELHSIAVAHTDRPIYVAHEYISHDLVTGEVGLTGFEDSCNCFRFGAFFSSLVKMRHLEIFNMESYALLKAWWDPGHGLYFMSSKQDAFLYGIWAKAIFGVNALWKK